MTIRATASQLDPPGFGTLEEFWQEAADAAQCASRLLASQNTTFHNKLTGTHERSREKKMYSSSEETKRNCLCPLEDTDRVCALFSVFSYCLGRTQSDPDLSSPRPPTATQAWTPCFGARALFEQTARSRLPRIGDPAGYAKHKCGEQDSAAALSASVNSPGIQAMMCLTVSPGDRGVRYLVQRCEEPSRLIAAWDLEYNVRNSRENAPGAAKQANHTFDECAASERETHARRKTAICRAAAKAVRFIAHS
ncbi:hypothetical protein OBBRIDRAFT_880056 [Obba rivulosa]|uniref:Uncharacterized protein n=1 Tax=Obba rivulosa TaxID=1052685 RepID=A0A8E2ASK9_9APHY|nr:hypothetical protein OBBRIDRAFT_880056 [Obba rivulosa]